MAKIVEQRCGCEDMPPDAGREDVLSEWTPISFCPRHEHQAPLIGGPPEKLYRCGECGFQSQLWERLERHVYRGAPGGAVRVGDPTSRRRPPGLWLRGLLLTDLLTDDWKLIGSDGN